MANDPMTLSSVVSTTIRDGVRRVTGLAAGPTDYDATNGSVMDISAYLSTCPGGIKFGGVTAAADALVYPVWVATANTAVDTGAVYFTWSADGTDGEVFKNVTDTTNLAAYQWHWFAEGEPA